MIWFREQVQFFDMLLRIYQDYLHLLFRWCLGLSMACYFVYCQVLFDWLIELSMLDYLITQTLVFFYHHFFPQELRSSFFESVLLKLIGLWILSYLIGEPLLIIVFSYTLYWLFTMYAQIFSRKPIESLSLFYYFSSFWFILPMLMNALMSLDQLFHFRIFDGFITPFCQYLGLDKVLKEWGFQLKSAEPASRTEAVHRDSSNLLGLTPVQRKYYQRLQQKYLNRDAKLVLSENLDDLKKCIKRFYEQNPVKFSLHSLPLSWESFFSYRMRLGSREQYHAFQAYYHHEIHSAWRLMSLDNPWMHRKSQALKHRNAFHQSENLEFILLLWIELKNQHQSTYRSEQKQKEFILMLSRWNRLENRHNDRNGDKLGPIHFLHASLWALVIGKPISRPISTTLLIRYLESFLQTKWLIKLTQLSLLELDQLETTLEQTLPIHRDFDLTVEDKAEFHQNMELLYGNRWKVNQDNLVLIDQYFRVHERDSHLRLNQGLFSQTIAKVKSHFMKDNTSDLCKTYL